MTRKEMMVVIANLAARYSPFDDSPLLLSDRWVQENSLWIAQADSAWFDIFLDLFVHPPDWRKYQKVHHLSFTDDWEMVAAIFLGQWISADLANNLPKVDSLLQSGKARLFLLDALSWVGSPDVVVLLQPLVENLETLSKVEQCHLAEAIGGYNSKERILLLSRMRQKVPLASETVRDTIDEYLPVAER